MPDTTEVVANQTEGQAEVTQEVAQASTPTLEELLAERNSLQAERDTLREKESIRTKEIKDRDNKVRIISLERDQLAQQVGRLDRIEQRLDEIGVGLKYALTDSESEEQRPQTRLERYEAELKSRRPAVSAPSQSVPPPANSAEIAWGRVLGLYDSADLEPTNLPPEIAQAEAEAVSLARQGDFDGAVRHVKTALRARAKVQAEEAEKMEKERKAALLKKGQTMQTDRTSSQGGDLGLKHIMEKPASQMTPQERQAFLTALGV